MSATQPSRSLPQSLLAASMLALLLAGISYSDAVALQRISHPPARPQRPALFLPVKPVLADPALAACVALLLLTLSPASGVAPASRGRHLGCDVLYWLVHHH